MLFLLDTSEQMDTLIESFDMASYEMARRASILTVILSLVIVISNIAAIVLLIVEHKHTKRPKNVSERYKSYKTAMGTVKSVKKVAYYIKRYDKKDSSGESIVEKSTETEVIIKSPEQIAKEQEESSLEIRKFRYKVHYEFTVSYTGKLYSGECYVYDSNTVNPGDIIEITYKPNNPNVNFTDYNMPVGFLSK